jgi:hypothetical protein
MPGSEVEEKAPPTFFEKLKARIDPTVWITGILISGVVGAFSGFEGAKIAADAAVDKKADAIRQEVLREVDHAHETVTEDRQTVEEQRKQISAIRDEEINLRSFLEKYTEIAVPEFEKFCKSGSQDYDSNQKTCRNPINGMTVRFPYLPPPGTPP